MTIDDIAASAGVSRNSVYEQYKNKGDVFLDLLDDSVLALRGEAEIACVATEGDDWDRVEATLRSVLAWVADHPGPAGALLYGADSAGPAARQIRDRGVGWFADRLRASTPVSTAPVRTADLVVGGIASIVGFRVLSGEVASIPDLAESLLTFIRVPFEPE